MKKSKNKNLSVFDAVQELDIEDKVAEIKRRKRSRNDAHRAQAAQHQSKIYDRLLECRILLQQAITTATSAATKEEELDSSSATSSKKDFREKCNDLLVNLLQSRKELQQTTFRKKKDDSDDESNSGEYDDDDIDYRQIISMKRRKTSGDSSSSSLDSVLNKEYEECRKEWKDILNRRHKDVKLHAGLTAKSQFKVLDSTFWQQVEATVEYEQIQAQASSSVADKKSNNHDRSKPRFDDTKVYQQLLKDYVAMSSGGGSSGGSSSASALAQSKKGRSKYHQQNQKKDVDRRASKGRKIRYTEIPKLANFTFPLSRDKTTNGGGATLDEDEWFQSLFGGVGKQQNN